jgi:AcrR family transcriptional regulator
MKPDQPSPKQRGRPAGTGRLSAARIAVAALARVDAEGVDALTIRRLAEDLGCEPMALYHYFPSKGHVLDAVVDELMKEVVVPADAAIPWLDRLAGAMESYQALVDTHPRAFPLLAMRRFNTPTSLAVFDAILGVLRDGGFSPRDCAYHFRRIGYFLNGSGLAELASRALVDDATRPVLQDTPVLPQLPNVTAVAPFLTLEQLGAIYVRGKQALLAEIAAEAPRR